PLSSRSQGLREKFKLPDQLDLAARLLHGFLRAGTAGVNRDLERLLELAVAEELDLVVQLANETALEQGVDVDGRIGVEAIQITDIDDLVLDAKDVREAALGQTALERHLAALV